MWHTDPIAHNVSIIAAPHACNLVLYNPAAQAVRSLYDPAQQHKAHRNRPFNAANPTVLVLGAIIVKGKAMT